MTEAVAVNVSVGTITSSPGPMPQASAARCSPAVAEFTATASTSPPMKAANFCSNSRALGPVVSHPDRSTAVAAAISSSPITGRKHGIPTGVACVLGANGFDTRRGRFGAPGDVSELCGRRYCMDCSLGGRSIDGVGGHDPIDVHQLVLPAGDLEAAEDRKSTRLNSSHGYISYAVFCLKKKKKTYITCLIRKKNAIKNI